MNNVNQNAFDCVAMNVGRGYLTTSAWVHSPLAISSTSSQSHYFHTDNQISAANLVRTQINLSTFEYFNSDLLFEHAARALRSFSNQELKHLILGLPGSVLFDDKQRTQYLASKVKELVNNFSNNKTIEKISFQSCQSGVFYDVLAGGGLRDLRSSMADWDSITLVDIDLLKISFTTYRQLNERIQQTVHDSIPIGIFHLANELKSVLQFRYGKKKEASFSMIDIWGSQKAYINGNLKDIGREIDIVFKSSSNLIVDSLPSHCFSEKNNVILSGTAAPLHAKHLCPKIQHVTVSSDPVHAASRGLLKLATFEPNFLIKPH